MRTRLKLFGVVILMSFSNDSFAFYQSDCRKIDQAVHCFNPPAPTPLNAEQEQKLRASAIAEELRILSPLKNGFSLDGCQKSLELARLAKRFDLERQIDSQCSLFRKVN